MGTLPTKSAQDRGKSSICTSKCQKTVMSFWKMRPPKCSRDCSESSICYKKITKFDVWTDPIVSAAARTLVDLVRRSWHEGLQPAVTKRSGTAARSKARVMLRGSWQAGLQLEVAKRCVEGSFGP